MQFLELIGQSEIKHKLIEMARSEKIPHAMLFLGPEGNGSLALALAFTQFIQCANKQDSDSCGVCPACIKNRKFIHPDVHFTFPVISKKSGEPPISDDWITEWRSALAANPYMNTNTWLQSIEAENRQGNITVRECHHIIQRIALKVYESDYKVQIIWMAEFLKEAGNTLLKVIEEPPQDTIFILIAENIELVLNTIISRTQVVKISAIEDADVKDALMKRYEMDENSARRIARISDGNFNAAINYASGEENANDKLLHRWLVCCFNLKHQNSASNVLQLQEWVEEISKTGRENQKIFLKYALFFLRECSLLTHMKQGEKLEGEELKFATGLSARLGPEQLETLAKLINRLYYHVERNGNPKILFMSNSFRIASVFQNEAVEID